MRYVKITSMDVANGPGIRVVLWVSGCRCHCPGCHNHDSWDFNNGEQYTTATEDTILHLLKQPHITGLTLSGGHPLEPENAVAILDLVKRVRHETNKSIWLYTGLKWENAIQNKQYFDIIKSCSVVVDGPFIMDQKDITLLYRGSKNQRVIDVKKSIEEDCVVLYDFEK